MKNSPLEKLFVDDIRMRAYLVVQTNHKVIFEDLFKTREEAKKALSDYRCPLKGHEPRIVPVLITDIF